MAENPVLRRFYKLIALVTAVCLMSPPSTFASAAPLVRLPIVTLQNQETFSIPESLGTLDEFKLGQAGKTLILIQDAHQSLEAQKHIAELIHLLVDQLGVKTVFEEGYEGSVPTDELMKDIVDPLVKQRVSYYLMDQLQIGGAEYAHINRGSWIVNSESKKKLDQPAIHDPRSATHDFSLIGADKLREHFDSVTWYGKAVRVQNEIDRDLNAAGRELERLIPHFVSKPMRKFLKVKRAYEVQKLDFIAYLREIAGFAIDSTGAIAFSADYPGLASAVRALDAKQAAAIEEVRKIGARDLWKELDQLELDLKKRFLKTEMEKLIVQFYDKLTALKRLNKIEMTASEYERVKTTISELQTQELANFIARYGKNTVVLSREWEDKIRYALRFYETALERDTAVRDAAEIFMRDSNEQTAVLVYGGFHTGRIRETLQSLGVTYAVVSPRITRAEKKHEDRYRSLMAGVPQTLKYQDENQLSRPLSAMERMNVSPAERSAIVSQTEMLGEIMSSLSEDFSLSQAAREAELKIQHDLNLRKSLAKTRAVKSEVRALTMDNAPTGLQKFAHTLQAWLQTTQGIHFSEQEILGWILKQAVFDFGPDEKATYVRWLRLAGSDKAFSYSAVIEPRLLRNRPYLKQGSLNESWPYAASSMRVVFSYILGTKTLNEVREVIHPAGQVNYTHLSGEMKRILTQDGFAFLDSRAFLVPEIQDALRQQGLSVWEDASYLLVSPQSKNEVLSQVAKELLAAQLDARTAHPEVRVAEVEIMGGRNSSLAVVASDDETVEEGFANDIVSAEDYVTYLLKNVTPATRERLNISDSRILIYGPGRHTSEIRGLLKVFPNATIYAADASWRNLEVIKKELDADPAVDKSHVKLAHADFKAMPFPEVFFDGMYAKSTFDTSLDGWFGKHYREKEFPYWMAEVQRILKVQGVFFAPHSTPRLFSKRGFHLSAFSDMDDLGDESGMASFVAARDPAVFALSVNSAEDLGVVNRSEVRTIPYAERWEAAKEKTYYAWLDDVDGNLTPIGSHEVSAEIIFEYVRDLQAGYVKGIVTGRMEELPAEILSRGGLDVNSVVRQIQDGLLAAGWPEAIRNLYLFPENASYVYHYEWDTASRQFVRTEEDLVARYHPEVLARVTADTVTELYAVWREHLVQNGYGDEPFLALETKRYGFGGKFLRAKDHEQIAALSLQFQKENLQYAHFGFTFTNTGKDFQLKQVNKLLAVRYLSDLLGLKDGQIAAFGDRGGLHGNDRGLVNRQGGFSTDEYDPDNSDVVPLSQVIEETIPLARRLRVRKELKLKSLEEGQLIKIDTEETERVLANTEIHGGAYDGRILDQAEIRDLGMQPKHKMFLNGRWFYFPKQVYAFDSGRLGVLVYVELKPGDKKYTVDGKYVARAFYRSHSQGGLWRYLPFAFADGQHLGWHAKGHDEDSIGVDYPILKVLNHIRFEAGIQSIDDRVRLHRLFAGTTWRPGGEKDAAGADHGYAETYVDVVQPKGHVTNEDSHTVGNIHGRTPPDKVHFTNPAEAPDYDQLVDEFEIETGLSDGVPDRARVQAGDETPQEMIKLKATAASGGLNFQRYELILPNEVKLIFEGEEEGVKKLKEIVFRDGSIYTAKLSGSRPKFETDDELFHTFELQKSAGGWNVRFHNQEEYFFDVRFQLTQITQADQKVILLDYGLVTARVFDSKNGKLQSVFITDKFGRSMMPSLQQKDSPMTEIGIKQSWERAGSLVAALYEYAQQTGGFGDWNDRRENYVGMWLFYHSRIDFIREFTEKFVANGKEVLARTDAKREEFARLQKENEQRYAQPWVQPKSPWADEILAAAAAPATIAADLGRKWQRPQLDKPWVLYPAAPVLAPIQLRENVLNAALISFGNLENAKKIELTERGFLTIHKTEGSTIQIPLTAVQKQGFKPVIGFDEEGTLRLDDSIAAASHAQLSFEVIQDPAVEQLTIKVYLQELEGAEATWIDDELLEPGFRYLLVQRTIPTAKTKARSEMRSARTNLDEELFKQLADLFSEPNRSFVELQGRLGEILPPSARVTLTEKYFYANRKKIPQADRFFKMFFDYLKRHEMIGRQSVIRVQDFNFKDAQVSSANIATAQTATTVRNKAYQVLTPTEQTVLFGEFLKRLKDNPGLFHIDHHYDFPVLASTSTTVLLIDFLLYLHEHHETALIEKLYERSFAMMDHADADILLSHFVMKHADDESFLRLHREILSATVLFNDYLLLSGDVGEQSAMLVFYYTLLAIEENIVAGVWTYDEGLQKVNPALAFGSRLAKTQSATQLYEALQTDRDIGLQETEKDYAALFLKGAKRDFDNREVLQTMTNRGNLSASDLTPGTVRKMGAVLFFYVADDEPKEIWSSSAYQYLTTERPELLKGISAIVVSTPVTKAESAAGVPARLFKVRTFMDEQGHFLNLSESFWERLRAQGYTEAGGRGMAGSLSKSAIENANVSRAAQAYTAAIDQLLVLESAPEVIKSENDKQAILHAVRHKTEGIVARIVTALPNLFNSQAMGGQNSTATLVLERLNADTKHALRLDWKNGMLSLSLVEDDVFEIALEGQPATWIDTDKSIWTEIVTAKHPWRPVVDALVAGLRPDQQRLINEQTGYGPRLAALYAAARSEVRADARSSRRRDPAEYAEFMREIGGKPMRVQEDFYFESAAYQDLHLDLLLAPEAKEADPWSYSREEKKPKAAEPLADYFDSKVVLNFYGKKWRPKAAELNRRSKAPSRVASDIERMHAYTRAVLPFVGERDGYALQAALMEFYDALPSYTYYWREFYKYEESLKELGSEDFSAGSAGSIWDDYSAQSWSRLSDFFAVQHRHKAIFYLWSVLQSLDKIQAILEKPAYRDQIKDIPLGITIQKINASPAAQKIREYFKMFPPPAQDVPSVRSSSQNRSSLFSPTPYRSWFKKAAEQRFKSRNPRSPFSSYDDSSIEPLSPFWTLISGLDKTGADLDFKPGELENKELQSRAEAFRALEASLWDENFGTQQRSVRDLFRTLKKPIEKFEFAVGAAQMIQQSGYALPEISREPGEIRLKQAWNPVAGNRDSMDLFDVEIDQGHNLYAVTGLNEIGKSTHAEMIGVIDFYAQMGLPVPAKFARLSIYRQVYTLVPSMQGVGLGESQHTGFIKQVRDLIRKLKPRDLVIIDEGHMGSDYKDLVALTSVLMEDLLKTGATVVYATHLKDVPRSLAQKHPEILPRRLVIKREEGWGRRVLENGVARLSGAIGTLYRTGYPDAVLESFQNYFRALILDEPLTRSETEPLKQPEASQGRTAYWEYDSGQDEQVLMQAIRNVYPAKYFFRGGYLYTISQMNSQKLKEGLRPWRAVDQVTLERWKGELSPERMMYWDFEGLPIDESLKDEFEMWIAKLQAVQQLRLRQNEAARGVLAEMAERNLFDVRALLEELQMQHQALEALSFTRSDFWNPENSGKYSTEGDALAHAKEIAFKLFSARFDFLLQSDDWSRLDVFLGVSLSAADLNLKAAAEVQGAETFAIRKARSPRISPAIEVDLVGDSRRPQFVILGANKSGKTELIRTVQALVLLARKGLPVPAEMSIPAYDKILTFFGAAESMAEGKSYFRKVSERLLSILNNAGPHSLVIMDEIHGSDYWELSALQAAILKYLNGIGATVILNTHMREALALAKDIPSLKFFKTDVVRDDGGTLHFSYKVLEDPEISSQSYGIESVKHLLTPEQYQRALEIRSALEVETAERKKSMARYRELVAAVDKLSAESPLKTVLEASRLWDSEALVAEYQRVFAGEALLTRPVADLVDSRELWQTVFVPRVEQALSILEQQSETQAPPPLDLSRILVLAKIREVILLGDEDLIQQLLADDDSKESARAEVRVIDLETAYGLHDSILGIDDDEEVADDQATDRQIKLKVQKFMRVLGAHSEINELVQNEGLGSEGFWTGLLGWSLVPENRVLIAARLVAQRKEDSGLLPIWLKLLTAHGLDVKEIQVSLESQQVDSFKEESETEEKILRRFQTPNPTKRDAFLYGVWKLKPAEVELLAGIDLQILRARYAAWQMLFDAESRGAYALRPGGMAELLKLPLTPKRYKRIREAVSEGQAQPQILMEMKAAGLQTQTVFVQARRSLYGYQLWRNADLELADERAGKAFSRKRPENYWQITQSFRQWLTQNGPLPQETMMQMIHAYTYERNGSTRKTGGISLLELKGSGYSQRAHLVVDSKFWKNSAGKKRAIWIQAAGVSTDGRKMITLHLRPQGRPLGVAYWNESAQEFEDFEGPVFSTVNAQQIHRQWLAWAQDPYETETLEADFKVRGTEKNAYAIRIFPGGTRASISNVRFRAGERIHVKAEAFGDEKRFTAHLPEIQADPKRKDELQFRYFHDENTNERLLTPGAELGRRLDIAWTQEVPNPISVKVERDGQLRAGAFASLRIPSNKNRRVYLVFERLIKDGKAIQQVSVYGQQPKSRKTAEINYLLWRGHVSSHGRRLVSEVKNFEPQRIVGKERYQLQAWLSWNLGYTVPPAAGPSLTHSETAHLAAGMLSEKTMTLKQLRQRFEEQGHRTAALEAVLEKMKSEEGFGGYRIANAGSGRYGLLLPLTVGKGNKLHPFRTHYRFSYPSDLEGGVVDAMFDGKKLLQLRLKDNNEVLYMKHQWDYDGNLIWSGASHPPAQFTSFTFSSYEIPKTEKTSVSTAEQRFRIPGRKGEIIAGVLINGELRRVDWFAPGTQLHNVYKITAGAKGKFEIGFDEDLKAQPLRFLESESGSLPMELMTNVVFGAQRSEVRSASNLSLVHWLVNENLSQEGSSQSVMISSRDLALLAPDWPLRYMIQVVRNEKGYLSLTLRDETDGFIQLNLFETPSAMKPGGMILGESTRIDRLKAGDTYGTSPSSLTKEWLKEKVIPWLARRGYERLYVKAYQGQSQQFFKEMGFQKISGTPNPYLGFDLKANQTVPAADETPELQSVLVTREVNAETRDLITRDHELQDSIRAIEETDMAEGRDVSSPRIGSFQRLVKQEFGLRRQLADFAQPLLDKKLSRSEVRAVDPIVLRDEDFENSGQTFRVKAVFKAGEKVGGLGVDIPEREGLTGLLDIVANFEGKMVSRVQADVTDRGLFELVFFTDKSFQRRGILKEVLLRGLLPQLKPGMILEGALANDQSLAILAGYVLEDRKFISQLPMEGRERKTLQAFQKKRFRDKEDNRTIVSIALLKKYRFNDEQVLEMPIGRIMHDVLRAKDLIVKVETRGKGKKLHARILLRGVVPKETDEAVTGVRSEVRVITGDRFADEEDGFRQWEHLYEKDRRFRGAVLQAAIERQRVRVRALAKQYGQTRRNVRLLLETYGFQKSSGQNAWYEFFAPSEISNRLEQTKVFLPQEYADELRDYVLKAASELVVRERQYLPENLPDEDAYMNKNNYFFWKKVSPSIAELFQPFVSRESITWSGLRTVVLDLWGTIQVLQDIQTAPLNAYLEPRRFVYENNRLAQTLSKTALGAAQRHLFHERDLPRLRQLQLDLERLHFQSAERLTRFERSLDSYRSEVRTMAEAYGELTVPKHFRRSALIDFNDLRSFTPEEIRETAIVMKRRIEVRFVIYNADTENHQLLHFKKVFGFRNVDWTRSSGETAFQALGPQYKEDGVVGFSRGGQDVTGGFSKASRKKISRFKLSAEKPGTMAVALSFDPEDPRYRWGISREGDFYVVTDALSSLAVSFLNQFVVAVSA